MPTFNIISGTVQAKSGFFTSPFGKDQISIQTGFIKNKELILADVSVKTEGLQAPDKNTTRFYLNDSADEWLCECSNKDFSKLQAIVLKQKYKAKAPPSSISSSQDSNKSGFAYRAGHTLAASANDKTSISMTAKLIISSIVAIAALFQCTRPDEVNSIDAAKISAENDAKARMEAAEDERRALENARLFSISKVEMALKANLREPESLSFEQKAWNLDNGAMCFVYRARNGFGGMNRAVMAIVAGQVHETNAKYKEFCPASANYKNYTF
jgi:hypothetical protein